MIFTKTLQKILKLIKDELGRQIIEEFVGLRTKICSYLKNNNDEDKKAKGTKNCVMQSKIKFQDYKNCLEEAQIERKIKYLQKTEFSLKEDQKELVKI